MARTRSPLYPAFDLRTAIERAQTLYKKETFHRVPTAVALEHWGYGPKSSAGIRCLAALIHFSLLDADGSKDDRVVWLSGLGQDIVVDTRPDSTERQRAIRKAALSPRLYQKLRDEFGEELPSDATLRLYLIKDMAFNPRAVKAFIAAFRSTLEFAGLDKPDRKSDVKGDTAETETPAVQRRVTRQPLHGGQVIAQRLRAGLERNMPLQTEVHNPDIWDLPIRLMGGGQAVLRVPVPLSEENFRLLKTMIETNLELQRPAIVVGDTKIEDGTHELGEAEEERQEAAD